MTLSWGQGRDGDRPALEDGRTGMPKVGARSFGYGAKGKKAAESYAKRTGKKVVKKKRRTGTGAMGAAKPTRVR